MNTLQIKATGRTSVRAQGSEVIVLGWTRDNREVELDLSAFDARWDELPSPHLGGWRKAMLAMKTEDGGAEWPATGAFSLYVLTHPWSGIARVVTSGRQNEIDLFSEETAIGRIDRDSLSLVMLSQAEADELACALDRLPLQPRVRRETTDANGQSVAELDEADRTASSASQVWTLTPIGKVVIAGGSLGDGGVPWRDVVATDPPKPFSGEVPTLTALGPDRSLLNTKVELPLGPDGHIALLRGADCGMCLVEYDHNVACIRLKSDMAGEERITVERLRSSGANPSFLTFTEDYDSYAEALAGIDPSKPVALYVPRWKGVASSTLNLFEQAVPVPLRSATPPELVTPADIARYARLLLSTGARHFVISGGDTFFLDLIAAMRKAESHIRFDILWHSNWVQMSEAHDWRLLQVWLDAHRDGLIQRFGVVKAGLDRFFQQLGVDAVFLPNVMRCTPADIMPSSHDGEVGIWLSGSSDYRKLPHASLLALGRSGKYRLKGSGLNYVARCLIDQLGIPVSQVWVDPIPRMKLYHEMASTAATLYVTLSECSPMLPLESMALGVPCLVGPSSHLFRDDDWLRSRLVVENPLDPDLIADRLDEAIDQREAIISHYRDYAEAEMIQARRGVANLVS